MACCWLPGGPPDALPQPLQVLLTHEEADAHDAQQALPRSKRAPQDPALVARVRRTLDKALREHYY